MTKSKDQGKGKRKGKRKLKEYSYDTQAKPFPKDYPPPLWCCPHTIRINPPQLVSRIQFLKDAETKQKVRLVFITGEEDDVKVSASG
jgi:hypothetical protein